MPGLELPEILESKSVFRDDWRSRVKQVVEAHLEDMLVGAHVLSLGKGQTKIGVRAGCCEDNVFGTETQVVVFKLCSPVIGEGIFQTKTDQQAVQRGGASGARAKVATVYIRPVPLKSAGYSSRFAVNKCAVKGDTNPCGNVVIPFVLDRGSSEQGVKIKLVLGNFHARPKAFTLDTENEHTRLIIAANLAASETANAVPVSRSHLTYGLKPLVKQHASASVNADIAAGPAKDQYGGSILGPGGVGGPDGQSSLNRDGSRRLTDTNFLGGGQVGYNRQIGRVVLGVEASIDSVNFKQSFDTGILPTPPLSPGLGTYRFADQTKSSWLATVGPRVGYTFNRALVYVGGGAAFANVALWTTTGPFSGCGGCFVSSNASSTNTGWYVAAGVEYSINSYLRAEGNEDARARCGPYCGVGCRTSLSTRGIAPSP